MKACVVQKLSGPSGMVYTDIDDPVDDGDNVVIDVRATGVCFPDLLLTKGEYQLKLPPPFVPGMETAGIVSSAPPTRISVSVNEFRRSESSAATRSRWPFRLPM